MSILVVGSVALDSIETPFGKRDEILGGSATYFSLAASLFSKVDIVAAVGKDFPADARAMFRKKGIGTDGLKIRHGKTFRWKGRYDYDLGTAHTIYTHLNVFKDFKPEIPDDLKNSKFVFLANIDPDLQHSVLSQMNRPKLVACDSMNYWIENKRRSLERLLKKIDILLLNDAEARELSGSVNLIKAARKLVSSGPKAVIIKRGENGVLYFSKDAHFVAPAYLLESLYDPTGAGDTFAGGMMGYLASAGKIDESVIRKAVIYGTIMASFAVEDFGVKRLLGIKMNDVRARYKQFERITKF